jgi:hypothetical protein
MALDLRALLRWWTTPPGRSTGGWSDLQRGVVRLAGPTALSDDPLRLLRAYRLLATAPRPPAGGRWRLAPATTIAIRRHRRGLSARPRAHRRWLLLIFASPRAWSVVRALAAPACSTGPLHHGRPAPTPILGGLRTATAAWVMGTIAPKIGVEAGSTCYGCRAPVPRPSAPRPSVGGRRGRCRAPEALAGRG